MQNGCFCCTLQNDLVEQIKELAAKKMFNYMLIEASGVSEPSQIAPLFELCEDEHDPDNPDPDHEHSEGPELGEVARLDTCITVVDAAEFYNNLDSMKVSLKKFYYPKKDLLNITGLHPKYCGWSPSQEEFLIAKVITFVQRNI